MAALTAERDTRRWGETAFPQKGFGYKVKGSTTIYKGALVVLDGGFAKPGASEASKVAVGVATQTVANSGADGAKEIEVVEGVYKFNNHGTNTVVAANVGTLAYIEDDNTVGNVSTSKTIAGRIVKLESNGVWVKVGLGLS